ncbi:SRP72 RNA-binding [Gracilaria domingensis]|nr:SRP72 RNA-binding [Gracilaria domingensis]
MGRNTAVLFVQKGRLDACRSEIEMLKVHYSDDSLVRLLEASLYAEKGQLENADKLLSEATDTPIFRAARIQLAASHGEQKRAADLLQKLFPDCPAAVCTASSFLEQCDQFQDGVCLLKNFESNTNGDLKTSASRELPAMLLRNGLYQESAEILRDCARASSSDALATAQLVVATSHFDPDEADRIASALPGTSMHATGADAERLEQLPPPKRKHLSIGTVDNADEVQDKLTAATQRPERKKKPKKKRLPKNYDPDGPPPDPERWLPKTLPSGYRKKKPKRDQAPFRGSQGADAASAEGAAQSLADKVSPEASSTQTNALPPRGRPRMQRRKKGRK